MSAGFSTKLSSTTEASTRTSLPFALVEVTAAFALMHIGFRAIKRFTPVGRWEWSLDLNFSAGVTLTLVALGFILSRRRRFVDYGITCQHITTDANVGMAAVGIYGLVGIVALICGLKPDRSWSNPVFGVTAATLHAVVTILILWALSLWNDAIRRWPGWWGISFAIVLPFVPILMRLGEGRDVFLTLLKVMSIVFSAALAESLFFFGYMQSRLNEAFGKSWRAMSISFGPGLLIAAGFFGFVHLLNTFDYFRWEGRLAWWWGLSSMLSLFHGFLRERTGSIVAPVIIHAFMDIASRTPAMIAES